MGPMRIPLHDRPAMQLRHRADVKTLVWAIGLMPSVVALTFVFPRLAGWLFPLSAYATFTAAVIAHNHNHCPTFIERRANALFASWISIFYGFPTYAWIPTHNENHHRFCGADGDATVRARARASETRSASRRHTSSGRRTARLRFSRATARVYASLVARLARHLGRLRGRLRRPRGRVRPRDLPSRTGARAPGLLVRARGAGVLRALGDHADELGAARRMRSRLEVRAFAQFHRTMVQRAGVRKRLPHRAPRETGAALERAPGRPREDRGAHPGGRSSCLRRCTTCSRRTSAARGRHLGHV